MLNAQDILQSLTDLIAFYSAYLLKTELVVERFAIDRNNKLCGTRRSPFRSAC